MVMLKAQFFVDGWGLAQQQGREQYIKVAAAANSLKRSLPGRLKLNVDAAVKEDGIGLGWLLRNKAGVFIEGASKLWFGRLSPWEAELVGIREALSWVKENGWDFIEVESDASKAISEIQGGSSISLVGIIAGDIRGLCYCFTEISFSQVRRSANRAAHVLAQASCSMSGCIFWNEFPYVFLTYVLNIDSINES
ncbi:unnamed protein product [Cuscuta epithymum]|uniref:RNase H type-1 domain-containing protein n=1 Tax=Cuscuta epithymum TaxID=186058 RepID=A0AAV0FR27_9ASTE|nr:unnamed protein product [Cuscuta epithymum]